MSEPRKITTTTTIEWRVATEPRLCRCGHEHYGRIPSNVYLAPQWQFCEDPGCKCRGLEPSP